MDTKLQQIIKLNNQTKFALKQNNIKNQIKVSILRTINQLESELTNLKTKRTELKTALPEMIDDNVISIKIDHVKKEINENDKQIRKIKREIKKEQKWLSENY